MSNKKDIFGDDLDSAKSDFENLLDGASTGKFRELKPGETIRGEILAIGKEEVFISTGTPQDGILPKAALFDKDKNFNHKVGDVIEAIVMRVEAGSVQLGKKNIHGSGLAEDLQDAFDMELPIEGKVLEVVKGGFRVEIMGQKGFCPISQIDLGFVKDPAPYVGKRFEFIITQLESRNLVVSRKKLLELHRAEHEGEFLKNVREGDTLEGKVVRLEPFGAFIDIGERIEGLIHISELSWSRIKHPEEVLSVGTQVRAKVLKIDSDGDKLKISLSLKQGGSELDPWFGLDQKLRVGQNLTGTVEKKENFGLFVQVLPGVTGLLPKSSWRDHAEPGSFESKKRGETIQVQVNQINMTDRRLSLAPAGEEVDDSWKAHSAPKQGLGTFGDLLKNRKVKS